MTYKHIRLFQSDPWVQDLYERAFPLNERGNLQYLLKKGQDIGQMMLTLKDGEKIAFYCVLHCCGICHIIYFAVEESLRGQGIGSEILSDLRELYPGERIIADIETEDPAAENNSQRIVRRKFYRRNGYEQTDIHYRWHGDDYDILSNGGNVTETDWDAFWKFIETHDKDLLF